jgi:protocatechuate 3,4-dioxygenase beta subunit
MKLLTVLALCVATAAAQDKAQDKNQDAAPKLGRIAGTVTAGGGGPPMKDVEIHVRRNTPEQRMAVTDAQGRYVIRDVAPGQLRLSANAPDSSGRAGFGPNAARQITLAPGQELTGVDFRMVIQGRISGKVVDQNNEPVVGISVFLVAREYSYGVLRAVFAGAGSTDDQGAYRLQRVQPGRAYAVLANRQRREYGAFHRHESDRRGNALFDADWPGVVDRQAIGAGREDAPVRRNPADRSQHAAGIRRLCAGYLARQA